jgi:hypothetical protein
MKEVLNFDVHNAGFIAVLPYLALTVVVIISGFVADLFIGSLPLPPIHTRMFISKIIIINKLLLANAERKWLSTTAVRKICQALGFSIAGMRIGAS